MKTSVLDRARIACLDLVAQMPTNRDKGEIPTRKSCDDFSAFPHFVRAEALASCEADGLVIFGSEGFELTDAGRIALALA